MLFGWDYGNRFPSELCTVCYGTPPPPEPKEWAKAFAQIEQGGHPITMSEVRVIWGTAGTLVRARLARHCLVKEDFPASTVHAGAAAFFAEKAKKAAADGPSESAAKYLQKALQYADYADAITRNWS